MLRSFPCAGARFGKLVVVGPAQSAPDGRSQARCRCDCGAESISRVDNLRRGVARSCGCDKRSIGRRTRKHGGAGTAEYRAWKQMVYRCNSPRCSVYGNYGARGIRVCQEWLGPDGYLKFLAHIGQRPSRFHSIDRINNDGHYEPGNVRWATWSQQVRNRRPRSRWGELSTVDEVVTKVDYAADPKPEGLKTKGVA